MFSVSSTILDLIKLRDDANVSDMFGVLGRVSVLKREFQALAQLGNTRPHEKELDRLITAAVDRILRAPGTSEGTKIMAKRVLDQCTGTRPGPAPPPERERA